MMVFTTLRRKCMVLQILEFFTKPLFFLTNFNRTLRESSITAGPPIWPAAAQPQKSTTEAGREGGTDGGFHTR